MDKKRKIFYVLSVLAITLFILVSKMNYIEVQDFLGEELAYILSHGSIISISLATWLFIFGIIFVRKNWLVWALLLILLLMHLSMLILYIAFSSKITDIVYFYLNVLSFGIIGS